MSYPGPPYWPPEFDYWCPSVELDIDVPSCEECPLIEELFRGWKRMEHVYYDRGKKCKSRMFVDSPTSQISTFAIW